MSKDDQSGASLVILVLTMLIVVMCYVNIQNKNHRNNKIETVSLELATEPTTK